MEKAILLFKPNGSYYSLTVDSCAYDRVIQSLTDEMNYRASRRGSNEEIDRINEYVGGLIKRFNRTKSSELERELELAFNI